MARTTHCRSGGTEPPIDTQGTVEFILVAWVQIGKAYVSYHLMGLGSSKKLLDGISDKLRGRIQGKTCFNFRSEDEKLFEELETLTADSLLAIRQAEFIAD